MLFHAVDVQYNSYSCLLRDMDSQTAEGECFFLIYSFLTCIQHVTIADLHIVNVSYYVPCTGLLQV